FDIRVVDAVVDESCLAHSLANFDRIVMIVPGLTHGFNMSFTEFAGALPDSAFSVSDICKNFVVVDVECFGELVFRLLVPREGRCHMTSFKETDIAAHVSI